MHQLPNPHVITIEQEDEFVQLEETLMKRHKDTLYNQIVQAVYYLQPMRMMGRMRLWDAERDEDDEVVEKL
jgi:hypothetical protein